MKRKALLPNPEGQLFDWVKPFAVPKINCHTASWLLVYSKSYRGVLVQIWTHPELDHVMHYHMQCCDQLLIANYDFRGSTRSRQDQIEAVIKRNYETFLEDAEEEKKELQLNYKEYRYGLQ